MADVKKFIKGAVDLPSHLKEAVESAHAPKIFYSTAGRLADKISEANPKMSEYEVMKRAFNQSTQKLDWERVDKPALEKVYGELGGSTFTESKPKRLRNTPEVVEERKRKANEFLDQPTEPWVPPKPELQAFDRSSIKDALEGFPDVPQSSFPRDQPTRASTSHVEELYNDPENRELIKKQIMRGLPLGGESFYASLYPVKQAVLEAGMPASKFDSWIHSLAPASARNSIMNEMAVGQFLRNMHAQGLPLDEATVAKQMAEFKKQFGMGLPLMPVHRTGVQNVLENNVDLRAHNLANIPTNYKIPTYGTQKAGDFAHSAVLDVHEAAGQSQGSRYHPYFTEAGGFGNTEYNAGEQGLLGIAKELGVPGGMAQAGRWFGGGELTGLRSPRGDALDLLEKQFAYTLQQQGKQPNPANIRAEVLKQIETGEGTLLPWYKKEGMPDVRMTGLQRKDGGQVEHMQAGGVMPRAGIYYPTSSDERSQAAGLPADFYRKGMADVASHGYHAGVDIPAGDARLTADLMGSRYVSPYMNKDSINALRLGAEFPVGEGRLRAELMKGLSPNVPTNVGLRYSRPFAEGGSVEHMQAGGLKTLMGEVLNRGGTYAARRLERAADEIPNLEKLFQQQALERAFLGDNARALMTIKPSDFEKYAAPIGDLRPESSSNIVDLIGIKNQGGYKDVPFLEVNKKLQGSTGLPFISGHEGRHRNRAMDQSGEQASLVQFLPRSELREPFERRYQDQYIDAIRKEMALTGNKVMPEKYYESVKDPSGRIVETRDMQRPVIDLPDLYAEGGAVHLQMGGKTPEPPGGSARLETFEAQHMEEGGDIMRQLFDHALDKGDIHEMTHAMLVKQHEAEHG